MGKICSCRVKIVSFIFSKRTGLNNIKFCLEIFLYYNFIKYLMELTLLIFNRNDNINLFDLINQLYDYFDYILIVDSSDKEKFNELIEFSAKKDKIKVLYVLPLGYPDLLRKYAYKKSPTDWIFLIDTDERINDLFKKDIKKIIEKNDADVYGIWRYPLIKNEKSKVRTLQIRLFNRNFIDDTGLIHELPFIKGRFKILDDKYFILHMLKFGINSEYKKLEVLDRYSYCTVPKKMKYILNFFHFKIDCEKEINSFEYFLFFYLKEVYSSFITKDIKRLFTSLKFSIDRTKKIIYLKNEPDGNEFFEISKLIRKIGIIKFLGLEDDSKILEINEKYKDYKGADLLIMLLKEKYRNIKSSNI